MSLLKSAVTISGLTFLSRITGLIRDILIARTFGASGLTDAFWVAFRIPNLLRRLFAEGAFSQAFVPILGEQRAKSDHGTVKGLIDNVAIILFLALIVTSIVGIIGAPIVVYLIASGFHDDPVLMNDAVWMTRIMFPYIVCMSLIALASGVLNTWKKFAIPAFTPVLLNLSMIFSCFFLIQYFTPPIYALAVGVMIGGVAQLSVQMLALAKIGLFLDIRKSARKAWKDPNVRRIIRLMGPAILGVSVAQISILINTNIASWLTPGSVSWLSFADRIMEFPTALLGVALGTVLLPSLSESIAKDDKENYVRLLNWGLKLTFLLGIPCIVGMFLLGEGLISTMFNYGAFGFDDVRMTKFAVTAYAVGLLGILCVKILAPGYYAQQNIKTPVKVAVVVLIATQIFNLFFVPIFDHAGLALSIGLGAICNSTLLYIGLRRRFPIHIKGIWPRFFLRVTPAVILLSLWLWFADTNVDWTMQSTEGWNYYIALKLNTLFGLDLDFRSNAHILGRAIVLGFIILVSMVIYFVALYSCGFKIKNLNKNKA